MLPDVSGSRGGLGKVKPISISRSNTFCPVADQNFAMLPDGTAKAFNHGVHVSRFVFSVLHLLLLLAHLQKSKSPGKKPKSIGYIRAHPAVFQLIEVCLVGEREHVKASGRMLTHLLGRPQHPVTGHSPAPAHGKKPQNWRASGPHSPLGGATCSVD